MDYSFRCPDSQASNNLGFDLSAPASGVIVAINYDSCDSVDKGDVLAVIE